MFHKIKFLTIFLSLICISYGTTNFVHLIGYIILAEPLQTIPGLTQDGCANECVSASEECIGFEYSNLEMDCILLTKIRNIVTNISECNFYIFDRIADTNFTGTNLSTDTDKLVYSNAYFNGSCPQGCTDEITECSIAITEEKCSEYATFFNASYDGSKCIFSVVNRSQFFCVDTTSPDNFMYKTDTEAYCYFKTTASAVVDMATFIQDCQAVSANSYPVTICSAAENDFFMGIMNNTITMIGLWLPTATAKPSRVYGWADGSTCQYRNWLGAEPDSYYNDTETVVQMVTYGRWRDVILTGVSNILYCKEDALTLQEYANNCESLDNCAQIN